MVIMQKIFLRTALLAAAFLMAGYGPTAAAAVGATGAAGAIGATGAAGEAEQPIILTGLPEEEKPAVLIDEYFRDLLQYEIHGREHTYRVILGQTTIEELAALPDVAYEEFQRYEGKLSTLRLADRKIQFLADDEGRRIVGIVYGEGTLPPRWQTRYGIGDDLFTRPDRQVELGTAGLEWIESEEASLWSSAREVYAVKLDDVQLVRVSIFPYSGRVSTVRVELKQDDQGRYYRMAWASEEGKPGGFLMKSFGRLALEKRERELTPETALQETALSSWTLINRPLGILPGRVTLAQARQALARRSDWRPQWPTFARIRLTPENGYDLEFGMEVPEAEVIFSGAEEASSVQAFTFEFHFTRGENFTDDTTDTTLRLNAERLAMKIINELELLGYAFNEHVETGTETQQWNHVSRLRSVRISIRPESRFQPGDTWSMLIRVQPAVPGSE